MLIRRYRLDLRIGRPALLAALVAGLALLALESLSLALTAPQRVNHDNLLSLAILCPTLVLLALKFPRGIATDRLGTYANGVFFVHVAFCIAAYRYTDLPRAWIFGLALVGSLGVTSVLIRTGLSKRLL